MSSTHKRFVAVLAVAVFGLGIFLRYTSENRWMLRMRPSIARAEAARELVAYNSNGTTSDVGSRSNVDLKPMETYYQVLGIIQDHYVERIDESNKKALAYSSVRIMLDSLKDPYTRFYEPSQAEVLQMARQGRYYGIGAVLAVRKDTSGEITEEKLYVVSALPGSPSEKAGLQTGDVITELDGKSVLSYDPFQRAAKLVKSARNSDEQERMKLQKMLDAEDKRITNGITINKAIDQLTGKVNKESVVTVSRVGSAKPLKIKVGTAETTVDPVRHAKLEGNIGYVGIRTFNKSAEDEFTKAMDDIEKTGSSALVLDLRDSFGGSPDVARDIASWFAPGKAFSSVQRSHSRKEVLKIPAFQAPEGTSAKPWTGRTIILINRGTSGLGEVLAAALKDNGVGRTVGQTTFGQTLQYTIYMLKDGSAVSITTGKYLSPLGKDFNLKGLAADVKVTGKATDKTDPVLTRAVELAKAQ